VAEVPDGGCRSVAEGRAGRSVWQEFGVCGGALVLRVSVVAVWCCDISTERPCCGGGGVGVDGSCLGVVGWGRMAVECVPV